MVVFCVRERESNVLRKNCIFFTLFYITKVAPSESVPLSKEREARNSSNICIQENLQKYTRRLALTRTRLKNFYILSSEEEEERERERERERGTFHSRARSFLSRREVEFPPLYISRVLKIGTLLACLPFLIKNPPRRAQVTHRRKNASTNTHIFKTRMAKYYPDIAKGAKGNRFISVLLLFCTVCSLFCANKSAISHPPEDLDVVSHRSFSHRFLLKNRFIHRRFVLRKQILPGRETNLRRGTFFISVSRF